MMRMIKFFVTTVALVTLVVGFFYLEHSYAATTKPKNCFLLLVNECFKNFDFKPNEKTWHRSAVVMDDKKFSYMRKNIDTLDSNIQIGTWFRWQKSFFMHQLCASFVPPQSCIPETGIPVYGGSLSGTTGQGFMTKTTGSYEWPVCWYIKPITRGNEKHCPGFVADPASTASQEEDGGVDLELDEPDEEEVANRFREMRDQWLESLGVKE